jgi:DNA-binding transcriptional MerR regulator
MTDAVRYAIGDLADLAGVSRRTVRYYVQEGLLPPPFGLGRGNHYGPEHLEQLLRVKTLQESGRRLDEIRSVLRGGNAPASSAPPVGAAGPPRTLWRRLELAPGVELHVSSAVHLPPPARLEELASWCRLHLAGTSEKEGSDD